MNFTKIRLVGLYTVDLPLVGALPSDSYILKEFDGLGPPVVDVSSWRRKPQARSAVFTVGLNPNYRNGETTESLRTTFYGLLTPGADDVVEIQIMNGDTVLAMTYGQVSNIDPVYFTTDPQVQITILCDGSYFQARDQVILTSLPADNPGLFNQGTAATGFHMDLTITASRSSWTLLSADLSRKMQFNYAFQAGDILSFDTSNGKRSITVSRGGAPAVNKIDILSADSTWFMLHGGWNGWLLPVDGWTLNYIAYTPLFWGV